MLRACRPVVAALRRDARNASSGGRNSLSLTGRAKAALQVKSMNITEAESSIQPHGICASQSIYSCLPTVDRRDPVLACKKSSIFARLTPDPIDSGEFALTEAAALTWARASFPPGTNARALADAGDLKGLIKAMNLKWRIVGSSAESGYAGAEQLEGRSSAFYDAAGGSGSAYLSEGTRLSTAADADKSEVVSASNAAAAGGAATATRSASPGGARRAFSTRTSRPDASAEANVRAANAGNGDGDEAAADVGEGFSSLEKGKGSIDDDTTSASSSAAASSLPSHKDASEADVCDEIGGDGGGFAMGAEVQLIHLAWGMPVAPHPPLGISTSTGVVDDPTDFRPTRLRALVNPYVETPFGSISHNAETASGKDALGEDCASEHPVDRSGGAALRHAERAMEMVTEPDTNGNGAGRSSGGSAGRSNRNAGRGRLDDSSYNRSPGAQAPGHDNSGVAAIARGDPTSGEGRDVNNHPGVQSSG